MIYLCYYHVDEKTKHDPRLVVAHLGTYTSKVKLADSGQTVILTIVPLLYRDAGDLRIFYTLQDVKNVLAIPKYAQMPCVKALLDTFERECCPNFKDLQKKEWESSRFPFIVFDGNHRLSTSILSKRFSKILSASYYRMCPPCLKSYRKIFITKELLLRRAFFALAVYALGCSSMQSLRTWPVVVSNYWNHQASFAITTILNNSDIPEPGDPVFSLWPLDLPKPDLVFYVNFPDDMHVQLITTRAPNNWKPRLLKFYQRIQNPTTIEISTRKGWDEALERMKEYIKINLGTKKLFFFRNLKFLSSGKNNTYVILKS
ncbi:UMP-CMP kinase 2, mitochondrial-like [Macrosteles quadrilineatus]|uniref:UMP-CMP kinase 2, mitochondrial-like n=1 Tax=Macrosteles quadrilineatus TaxID=74068 RepID=UPI0023E09C8D|nr:UMP-CMP kinase 2, mitochondrial-like [Macrosteles quadrilineatus]